MTYFGTTMNVNGVLGQMIEHRILHYVNPDLPYNDIKHKLLYEYYTDFAFSKPIKLDDVLTDCLKYKIIPIVNICATEGSWKSKNITPAQYGKIGGVIRDILKERGFRKGLAYQSGFNEPGKLFTTDKTIEYTNALHDIVCNDFDVVYGNDEANMLDWNKMGVNCRAKVMGIHHLSSLGNWSDSYKHFSNIKNFKTIANTYGKKIIGTECGSWFKDYCKEGHQVNLDIMAECKKYDYLGCLTVLPDINEQSKSVWKLLGYRVWNSNFTSIKGGSQSKFNEFMNYIKINGDKPNFGEVFEMYGIEINYVKPGCHNEECRAVQKIMIDEGYDLSPFGADSWYGGVTKLAIDKWQSDNGLTVDSIVGKETWQWIFENIETGLLRFMQMLARTGRYK